MNFNRQLGVRISHNLEKKKELKDENYTMTDTELKVILAEQKEASVELISTAEVSRESK